MILEYYKNKNIPTLFVDNNIIYYSISMYIIEHTLRYNGTKK